MSNLDDLLEDAKTQLGALMGCIGGLILGDFKQLDELESLVQAYIVAQAEYSMAYAQWLSPNNAT